MAARARAEQPARRDGIAPPLKDLASSWPALACRRLGGHATPRLSPAAERRSRTLQGVRRRAASTLARAARTTPDNIEDACAFAWVQFLRYQPTREQNWKGWLYRTAEREAFRLDGVDRRTTHLLGPGEPGGFELPDPSNGAWLAVEVGEALDVLKQLRPRLQRIAFLQAMGHSYMSISDETGDSLTRVNQLVRRARDGLREVVEDSAPAEPTSPRAQRLQELEQRPPEWLVDGIGRPPNIARPVTEQLAWRRAALALDDLRTRTGTDTLDLRGRPAGREEARWHHAAARAVARLEDGRAQDSSGKLER